MNRSLVNGGILTVDHSLPATSEYGGSARTVVERACRRSCRDVLKWPGSAWVPKLTRRLWLYRVLPASTIIEPAGAAVLSPARKSTPTLWYASTFIVPENGNGPLSIAIVSCHTSGVVAHRARQCRSAGRESRFSRCSTSECPQFRGSGGPLVYGLHGLTAHQLTILSRVSARNLHLPRSLHAQRCDARPGTRK